MLKAYLQMNKKRKVTEFICYKDLGGKQRDYSELIILKLIKYVRKSQ